MHKSALFSLAGFAAQVLSTTIVSNLYKRDCEPLPQGHGPIPDDDTPDSFSAWPEYASIAQAAGTPTGYSKAFGPKQATTTGQGYLGTDLLETYDASVCAAACEAKQGCSGFDIFFERAPSQNPAVACPNPPSTTLIKCNYWVYPVTDAAATQEGQWRNEFHVLVAGVVGFNKVATTTTTTLVTTTSTPTPPAVTQPQCASRPVRLCCLNIAPWSTNSAVWGGICGYTPTDPGELVGARCIARPASGQCPAGTSQACCGGTVPGQCALGTRCARV